MKINFVHMYFGPHSYCPSDMEGIKHLKRSYELNRHVILARGIQIYPVQEIQAVVKYFWCMYISCFLFSLYRR